MKRIIGATNPNKYATRIVIDFGVDSVSSVNAKIVKTMIVNEGGTNSVEMNRANLFGSIITCAEFISVSSDN